MQLWQQFSVWTVQQVDRSAAAEQLAAGREGSQVG